MMLANRLYFQVYSTEGNMLEMDKEGVDFVVGRQSKTGGCIADVCIHDSYASRRHCRVFRNPENADQWLLEDLGSNNGTKLDGFPVTTPVLLQEEALIQVGTARITISHSPKFPSRQQESTVSVLDDEGGHDETIVLSSKDATLLLSPKKSAGGSFLDDDATVVRPSDEDPTVVRPSEYDATVVRPSEDDATVVRPSEDDATVVRSLDDDATVVRPPDDDPTMVRSPAGSATFADPRSPSSATFVGTQTIATHHAAAHHAVPESYTVVSVTGDGTMANTHEANRWPAEVSSVFGGLDPIKVSMNSGMIQNFLRAHYLDAAQVAELLKTAQHSGQTFFKTLLNDPSVQKVIDVILTNVAETFGWAFICDREEFTPQAMETDWLPFSRARELGCVMLKSEDRSSGKVRYGTLDPFDIALHDWVERCSEASAERVLVHPDIFYTAIQTLKGQSSEREEDVGVSIDFSAEDETHIRDQIQNVDVPQMVNYFLYRAQLQGASDIHIEPTEEFLLVRLRVDGILHQEISLPMGFHSEMASRMKILSGMDVVEKRRPQDGRLAVVIRNNPIDVRVSSYPTVFGEKFVLRLLDKNALRPSIETLGLMERDRSMLREKLAAPYGLVMISGPTGSGKTTTLYSCLGGMDRNRKNILTVEDPVEYRMAGVHQMQVNHKIGLTFANGLRTILRQDPDVVMVGETRDSETAAMAVQASLTGHIVFSTIHTNDAVGVITRMLDMGIEPFLVSTALSLAVAQRLVRTICKHCRISVTGQEIFAQLQKEGVTKERLDHLDIHIDPHLDYTQGEGCMHCRDTGYQGRRAVFELFEMTDEARNIIMGGEVNASKLKALAKQRGMTTLITHGVRLVEEEVTTFHEVLRVLGEDS